MPGVRAGFGENIEAPMSPLVGNTPSTSISGLTSRQVVFGGPTGGVAQSSLLEFDSTQGFLGIGTTVPAGPIQVNAGTTAVLTVTTLNRVGIGTTVPAVPLDMSQQSLGNVIHVFSTAGQFGNGAPFGFAVQSGEFQIFTGNAAAMTFGTQTSARVFTERIRMTSVGRVGIGTTVPTAVLTIASTAGTTNVLTVVSGTTNTVAFNIKSTGAGSKIGFFTTVGSARPSSYTPTAVTSGRVVPTTQSTVVTAVVSTAQYVALANAFNQLLGVVRTQLKDFAGYGLLST